MSVAGNLTHSWSRKNAATNVMRIWKFYSSEREVHIPQHWYPGDTMYFIHWEKRKFFLFNMWVSYFKWVYLITNLNCFGKTKQEPLSPELNWLRTGSNDEHLQCLKLVAKHLPFFFQSNWNKRGVIINIVFNVGFY